MTDDLAEFLEWAVAAPQSSFVRRWTDGHARAEFIEKHGPGPHPCYFCGELAEKFHVHFIDHDKNNDDVNNLARAHPGCHMSHHKAGVRRRRAF